jgi:hypothetical protein
MSTSYSGVVVAEENEEPAAEEPGPGVVVPRAEMPEREIDEPDGFVLYSKDEKGRQINFKPQEDYQCFPAGDWVKMGHLITDYHWLFGYAMRMQLVVANMESQIGNLTLEVQRWKDMTNRVDESRLFAVGMFKEERTLKLRSDFSNKVTMWLAVGVAVLEAGVIGALAATR